MVMIRGFGEAYHLSGLTSYQRRIMHVAATLAAVVSILLLSSAPAQAEEWRNFTNANAANDLLPEGSVVWAATTGGLVLFAPPATQIFTNADGLGGNQLSFVALDSTGRLWTGGEAGRLSSRNPANGQWTFFTFTNRDGSPLRLTSATADGDLLWVGSNVGVHKFDTEHLGGEIAETYRRFGELPADEEVHDVLIVGDNIWVATSAGCAVARTDDINLQDYAHWRSFSRNNSDLQYDEIVALAELQGTVFAATIEGLYTFAIDGGDSTWSRVPGSGFTFYDLFQSPTEILGATSSGIVGCSSQLCTLLSGEGMAEQSSKAVCRTDEGTIWVASYGGNGYSVDDGNGWITTTVTGPAANEVHDLAVTPDGLLWAVHPGAPTSMWNGSAWRLIDSFQGGPSINTLAVDQEGYLWLGGHGVGAARLNPADPDNSIELYDAHNSSLRGSEPPPNDWYIVVHDIVVDDSGRVWFANAYDYDDRVLAFYDHGCWGYLGTGDGFPNYDPLSLFPLTNEVLIGFVDHGLADMDVDTTLPLCFNGTQVPQIPRIIFMDEDNGIPAPQVRSMLVDVGRKVWVGTSGGLAYFDPIWGRFRPFTLGDVAAPTINALLADGGNNLWVGADEGLFRVTPDGRVTHYRPDNSGLADLRVTSLAIDTNCEILWIGTRGGISRLAGAAKCATPLAEILAYPNPFIISDGDEVVKFDAAFGTTIQVYTVAGELVADLGTSAEWNGRNAAGKLVASGVYVFIAADANNTFARGKFAVIRK